MWHLHYDQKWEGKKLRCYKNCRSEWLDGGTFEYIKLYHMQNNCLLFYIGIREKRYHAIRERAETDSNIMSIIIDGMDQNTTQLPHTKRLQKSDVNLWHFRTHITGCIVHGHHAVIYMDCMQWPHDPNHTINILLQVWYSIQTRYHIYC